MSLRPCLLAAVCCLILANSPAAPGTTPKTAAARWSTDTAADLRAMHELIRDNHPGPVDQANPGFNAWLEQGYRASLAKAVQARSEADYWRALRFYSNGFRDGHLAIYPARELARVWPGFLTTSDSAGRTTVMVSRTEDVPVGAEVLSCDGVPAPRLLDTRVHPYRTNAGIPHERLYTASYLLIGEADDPALLRACSIRVAGKTKPVKLQWRPIAREHLAGLIPVAQQRVVPELGLRKVDGVWFVSLPSFNWWGEDAKKMEAMLAALRQTVDELHRADRVVIDVRGNGGGNSEWANRIAKILWGDAATQAVLDSFDETVDWRVSARNIAKTREAAERARVAGLKDDAEYRGALAARMEVALSRGEPLLPESAPPRTVGLPADYRTPFSGKVFFLTDMRCASACLDFADIVRRMPGVIPVGQPTSADAVYIDNVEEDLPSGNALLNYSLKVYRHRVRGNNQWYDPAIAWMRGPMTDTALAKWISGL